MPSAKPAIVCKKVIRMASAVAIAILLAGLPRATAHAANEVAVAQVNAKASPFPRPAGLEPNIDFWVKAFTSWSERDFVIHGRDNVSRIYEKFHMPDDGAPAGEEIVGAEAYLKAKYGDILKRLPTGQQPVGCGLARPAPLHPMAASMAGSIGRGDQLYSRSARTGDVLRQRSRRGSRSGAASRA